MVDFDKIKAVFHNEDDAKKFVRDILNAIQTFIAYVQQITETFSETPRYAYNNDPEE